MINIFAVVISALVAVIAIKNLRLAFFLILATLPSYLIRFNFGPIPTTLLEIMILIFVIVWLIKGPRPNLTKLFKLPLAKPIALLLIAATIGIFVTPDHLSALGIWKAYFIEPVILLIAATTIIRDQKDRDKAMIALGLGAMILSSLGIIQKLTGFGIPFPWNLEGRITSIFDYPNALGLYLAPIVTFGIILLLIKQNKTKKESWFWILTVIIGLLAIVFAKTEAALVSIPTTIILCSLFVKRLRLPMIAIGIVGVVLAVSIPVVRTKILLHDTSGEVRRSQWTETVSMLKDYPVFGTGLNGYPEVMIPYHQNTVLEIFQYPHNIILNIWTELGLLGLIAFIWLAISILKSSTFHHPSSIILFAPLLQMFIHGLVDVPFFKNDLSIMTLVFLALLFLQTAELSSHQSRPSQQTN